MTVDHSTFVIAIVVVVLRSTCDSAYVPEFSVVRRCADYDFGHLHTFPTPAHLHTCGDSLTLHHHATHRHTSRLVTARLRFYTILFYGSALALRFTLRFASSRTPRSHLPLICYRFWLFPRLLLPATLRLHIRFTHGDHVLVVHYTIPTLALRALHRSPHHLPRYLYTPATLPFTFVVWIRLLRWIWFDSFTLVQLQYLFIVLTHCYY